MKGGIQTKVLITIEIEGSEKPGLRDRVALRGGWP